MFFIICKWLILNNLNKLDNIPQKFLTDTTLHEVFDVAEFLALSKEKQFAYQQDLKARLDYKNVMDYAIETATEEGRKKGIEKGIAQGIEQGIKQTNIEMAKKLHLAKVDMATIVATTELSEKEILRYTK